MNFIWRHIKVQLPRPIDVNKLCSALAIFAPTQCQMPQIFLRWSAQKRQIMLIDKTFAKPTKISLFNNHKCAYKRTSEVRHNSYNTFTFKPGIRKNRLFARQQASNHCWKRVTNNVTPPLTPTAVTLCCRESVDNHSGKGRLQIPTTTKKKKTKK